MRVSEELKLKVFVTLLVCACSIEVVDNLQSASTRWCRATSSRYLAKINKRDLLFLKPCHLWYSSQLLNKLQHVSLLELNVIHGGVWQDSYASGVCFGGETTSTRFKSREV